jgi:hypothetical protein
LVLCYFYLVYTFALSFCLVSLCLFFSYPHFTCISCLLTVLIPGENSC